MKSEDAVKREMNQRIIDNINYLMEQSQGSTKPYSQKGFVSFCQTNYGIAFNQGTVSRILNPSENRYPSPAFVYYMSKYLNVDLDFLMFQDCSQPDKILRLTQTANERSKQNNLIFDISHPFFEQYIGDYECHFCPTISKEAKKEQFLHGTIHIREDWNNLCCRVEIRLNTNQLIQGTNEPYYKIYKGTMFISGRLETCYCIVENPELGECNFIAFRHVRPPNNTNYLGGMAAVLTVSAGGDNVPTMHRMLINRGHINDQKLNILKGNLKLNHSKILISKEEFDTVIQKLNLSEEVINRIINNAKTDTYYQISERTLRDISSDALRHINRSELISQIRDASTAIYYNKISKKLDEHIMELLND